MLLYHVPYIFFFTAPATTQIYTLSLHDALPIFGLRPGARPPVVGAARRDRPVDPRPTGSARRPRDTRLRDLRVPHRVPRGPQLLRRGPLGAVPGHHQGPPLHLRARRPATAGGADDVLRHLQRPRSPHGADPHVHRGGGMAARARRQGGERPPRALPGGAARVARRHAVARVGPPARGPPRGGQGPRDGPRAEPDRQRARGPGAHRRGARGPAGAAPREARAPAHALHRVAGRARRGACERGGAVREPGDPGSRHRRRPRARPEVPALLDVERARRRAPGAPGALRALRAGRPRQRQCELSGVREASGDIVRGMTRPAFSRIAVLAGVVVVLDQITKLIALARLVPGTPLGVIDGFLALTLVLNPGLAFGILASVPTGGRRGSSRSPSMEPWRARGSTAGSPTGCPSSRARGSSR